MSTTIDERVVEMRFDNKQFESNVQTSLSTLDKLKQSLDLSGATKGLTNVTNAAKNFSMAGVGSAVETVQAKFSALEVMAVTALANITNSAVNAGKRIVSALTIDPVKTGFQEYETQINAVQTILANTESKGSTLKDVNNALDELNTYADKTIYNFTEMTRNIGTFTAAGIDLDTSVSAIKGIANLAAVSGSTSQQASTAMYQLSQALASGTVKLMDWNSVVNAGMGGQVFQDALKETARVHGIAIDQMIKNEGSFRETLKNGWLTSEVLTETLSKFTGDLNEEQLKTMGYTEDQIKSIVKMGQTANDAATKVKTFTQLFDTLKEAAQSGWTQSWEIIVGDFEEAKELLTEVSDVFGGIINESANARNELLQGWKDLGGRKVLIDAFRNAFEGVGTVIKPIKEAFSEIFPPMTAQQLYNITEGLKNLTEYLKIGDTTAENLKRTFKGAFAVLDIGVQAFKAVAGGIADLIGYFAPAGDGILGMTAKFGDYLVKLDETVKSTDIFREAIGKVVNLIKTGVSKAADILKSAGEAVGDFVRFIKEKFEFPGFEMFHALLERTQTRMSQVGKATDAMADGVTSAFKVMCDAIANSRFLQVLEVLWDGVKTIVGGIVGALGSLVDSLVEKLTNANFNGLFDAVSSISFGGIAIGITKFLKSVTEPLKGFQDILDGVTGILDGVRGCFEAYQTQLKAGTLLKIASAIAILTASIVALSLIDSDKLAVALVGITALFTNLMASMAILSKIDGFDKKTSKAMASMVLMSTAILLLSAAMKSIADLDWDGIAKGITGIAGLSTILVASAKILSSGSGKMMKGASGLVVFAAAIKILASACTDLSGLSWEELGKGLAGVGGLMAEVSIFLNTAKFSSKAVGTATGILILSGAMKILASVCKDFGAMDWTEIGKGLTGVGVLLTEIALFTNLTGNAKHVMSTGTALVAIAASMKIFASAMADFGAMSWEEIGKGLAAMGGALAEVAIAVNLMPKNMTSIGTGLVIVAGALEIIANVLGKFGGFSWEEIGKGLVTLGGALTVLVISLNAMKGTIAGSAALLVAAGALAVLAPTLSLLGAMSWEGIAKGLITLAGSFTVLGVAGAVLTPFIPTILGLAAAFTLVSAGIAAISAALMGFSIAGFIDNISSVIPAFKLIMASFVAGVSILGEAIIKMIPFILAKIGEGLVDLCKVIADGAPVIGEALVTVLGAVVKTLVEGIPLVIDGVVELLMYALNTLVEYTPKIVQAVFDILVACLKGIADNIGLVVETAIDIVLNFIEAIANKLPDVIQAGFDLLLAFINGITNAIETNTPLLVEAMRNLALALVDAAIAILTGNVVTFKEVGQRIMNSGLIQGIKDKLKAFTDMVKNVISSGLKIIAGKLSEWTDSGKDLILHMITGIDKKASDAKKAITTLLTNAKDAVADQLSKWKEAGSNLIGGLISGIKDKARDLVDAAKDAVSNALNSAKNFLGIHSPSTKFAEVGKWSIEGLINGLSSNANTVANTMKSIGKSMISGIKDVLGIHSPSKEMQEVGEDSTDGLVKGLDKGTDDVAKASKKVGEATIDGVIEAVKNGTDAIEEVFENGATAADIFWQQYANVMEKVEEESQKLEGASQAVDELGTSLTEVADKSTLAANTISSVSNEKILSSTRVMQFASDVVYEFQNRYGELFASLGNTASLDAAKAAVETLAVSTYEASGKAAEGAAKIDEAINQTAENAKQKSQETQDDLVAVAEASLTTFEDIIDSFAELRQSFIDNIKGQMDIFSEFDTSSDLSTEELLNNMQTQVDGVSSWADNLQTLAERGISQGLLQYLAELGPKGYEYVSTFVKMTEEQLEKANELYAKSLEIPEEASTKILSSYAYAGLMAAKGFEEGISQTSTTEAATKMGENTLNALQTALEEHSPSKATYEMGQNLVKGFDNGITDTSNSAVNTIRTFGINMLNAFKTELSVEKFVQVSKDICGGMNTGFLNNEPALLSSITKILNDMLTMFKNRYNDFNATGQETMMKFTSGIESRYSMVTNAINKIVADILTKIQNKYSEFKSSGQEIMTNFVNGIQEKSSDVVNSFVSTVTNAILGVRNQYNEFHNAGVYLVDGFISGIEDNIDRAARAAAEMARAASDAANEELDINSPSKVAYKTGSFFGLGFVNAITEYTDKAYTAGKEMASSARTGLGEAISRISDAINGDLDMDPTIRPVLDLSNVEEGASRLNALFSRNQALSISADMNRKDEREIQNGDAPVKGGNTYQFTQNNYSPKALSRVEIYRQTKNQFSAMERMVEA